MRSLAAITSFWIVLILLNVFQQSPYGHSILLVLNTQPIGLRLLVGLLFCTAYALPVWATVSVVLEWLNQRIVDKE